MARIRKIDPRTATERSRPVSYITSLFAAIDLARIFAKKSMLLDAKSHSDKFGRIERSRRIDQNSLKNVG